MKTSSVTARNLKGDFYLGQGGEVYYYDENLANKISGDENGGNDGENGEGDSQPVLKMRGKREGFVVSQ